MQSRTCVEYSAKYSDQICFPKAWGVLHLSRNEITTGSLAKLLANIITSDWSKTAQYSSLLTFRFVLINRTCKPIPMCIYRNARQALHVVALGSRVYQHVKRLQQETIERCGAIALMDWQKPLCSSILHPFKFEGIMWLGSAVVAATCTIVVASRGCDQ